MLQESDASRLPSSPPEAWQPLRRLARAAVLPLERFLHIQAASGIVLFVAAAVALFWANSAWAESYTRFFHTPLGLRIGAFVFERPLEWFINDALMVVFFFVVGMEVRREIHGGELSEWRRAALPAAAALGGMLAPAALYLMLSESAAARSGWGVPMATDIAFALGILALLGKRVPPALRVLLLALAVIDDLGAILVIAIFYSSGIALSGILLAAFGLAGVLALQRLGVRAKLVYVAPALVVWSGIYMAGVHPTIAGVIVGLLTPVRAWLGAEGFVRGMQHELERLKGVSPNALSTHELALTLRHVNVARREALSPAESLIESLHPWVAFGIMPVFALANAGVTVPSGALDREALAVSLAIGAALVCGKPLGVLIACWCTLRLRIATLPRGLTLRHISVLGVVAGIGFTMSLFVAQLAFADAGLLGAAKLGVLVASAVAAFAGLLLGVLLLAPVSVPGSAETADEAERQSEL
jgi:NhaA family Na+:H+ antiporter